MLCIVESRDKQGKLLQDWKKKKDTDNPEHIMQWNAEGVSNKREDLQHFLHENSIHICCIQETHLKEGKPLKIRGYREVSRGDRQGRSKGGVLTLVRNDINASETSKHMEEV